VNSGNSFEEGAIVFIDGATPGALNGEARVLSTTSTGFTFATDAPDGAASGNITGKYAPVHSWAKIYADTNVAVWQSQDPQANGHCLRIDDSGGASARVRGFESMTDASTGTGTFPSDLQLSGGGYWAKSVNSNATAVRWQVVLLSCHYDILDWLAPDWVFDTATGQFDRGRLRCRPRLAMHIHQTDWRYWPLFEPHHYLKLPRMIAATCYVATIDGEPVAHLPAARR